VVNVLGRNITAKIGNLRKLDWQSLGINFVMIFSPNAFRGAPVTHLATLAYKDGGTPAEEADPDCRGWRRSSLFIPSPVVLPMSSCPVPICV
jgi:hypothetical protein